MSLDIGKKIQNSRKEASLTQEQAAEKLGVSRQTISNWENEKSYPDIISVIKMSEIYDVSLDYLLKGEKTMTTYYDYLEESTNVVKSNEKKGKLALILTYLAIWAFSMVVFWMFTGDSDALGYSIMFLFIILPLSTIVISAIAGYNNYWGNKKWLFALALAIMYMLAEYGTFSLANTIEFGNINIPEYGMILRGFIYSAIGIGIGISTRKYKKKN